MNGSIVAITGGAGALGSTLASVLVGRGAKVALLDTERSRDRLASLVKDLGGSAVAVVDDFAKASAWAGALTTIKEGLGGLPTAAALIAGSWEGGRRIDEGEETYERMMQVNTETAYRALRALLPGMIAANAGSIVVVGSRAVERPWTSANAATYAASKAATVAMAQAAAQEVLSHHVRINAILPSTMDTAANRASMPKADPSKWVSLTSAAGVIAFLLSDEARDISGAAIPIYGRA